MYYYKREQNQFDPELLKLEDCERIFRIYENRMKYSTL